MSATALMKRTNSPEPDLQGPHRQAAGGDANATGGYANAAVCLC